MHGDPTAVKNPSFLYQISKKQVLTLYCLYFKKQQWCALFRYNYPQTLGLGPKYGKVLLKKRWEMYLSAARERVCMAKVAFNWKGWLALSLQWFFPSSNYSVCCTDAGSVYFKPHSIPHPDRMRSLPCAFWKALVPPASSSHLPCRCINIKKPLKPQGLCGPM